MTYPSPLLLLPLLSFLLLSPSAAFPISLRLSLVRNVYPDGIFYATVKIGGKPYFLEIDTGGDLSWVHCDAPCINCAKGPHPWYVPSRANRIPFSHPLCKALQETGAAVEPPTPSADTCPYHVKYAEQSSYLGFLVEDAVSIPHAHGSTTFTSRLGFGCGYDQQGSIDDKVSPTDGLLGLGDGPTSIFTQLRTSGIIRGVLGHCMTKDGAGFLFLGDGLVPKSGVTWTPMSTSRSSFHYVADAAGLSFGNRMFLWNGMKVTFDSGTTNTYLKREIYDAFVAALMEDMRGKPVKVASDDKSLPICWKGQRSFEDYVKYFNPVSLKFSNGAVLEIPPQGYLIFTEFRYACLGILSASEGGLPGHNIIGAISMMDYLMIFDSDGGKIGWTRRSCGTTSNSIATNLTSDFELYTSL